MNDDEDANNGIRTNKTGDPAFRGGRRVLFRPKRARLTVQRRRVSSRPKIHQQEVMAASDSTREEMDAVIEVRELWLWRLGDYVRRRMSEKHAQVSKKWKGSNRVLRAWERRGRPASGCGGFLGVWYDRVRRPVFKEGRGRCFRKKGRIGVRLRLAGRARSSGRRGEVAREDASLVDGETPC